MAFTSPPLTDAVGRSVAALWAGRIMTAVFTLFMVFDTAIKLVRLKVVDDTLGGLGYPAGIGFPIGLLQALLFVLYLVPRTALLGAVLLTGFLGGAVASHVRAGSPLFSHVLFGVYMGLLAWGGLWFRDARLRALFPLKRRDA